MISRNSLKVSLLICMLYLLSPVFVNFFWQEFTTTGWLAIGLYTNDFIDGFSRSFQFSVYFFLIIYIILTIFFKIKKKQSFYKKINFKLNNKFIYNIIFVLLLVLYIIGFSFNLGITGIETPTDFKLSGILHYFRSYIVPIFIFYYLVSTKASLNTIIVYSLIAGLTSSSRFVGFLPLWLFIIASYINPFINNNANRIKAFFALILIFSIITLSRNWIYSENINDIDIEFDIDLLLTIINQIFLRIGIGRDVILSSEVLQNNICTEYLKFFLIGHSCQTPSFDFYGIDLEGSKFYLAAPTLASFYVLGGDLHTQILIYIIFLIQILFSGLIHIQLANFGYLYYLISLLSWILSIIFLLIGPILFFNYLIILNSLLLIFVYFLQVIKKGYQ